MGRHVGRTPGDPERSGCRSARRAGAVERRSAATARRRADAPWRLRSLSGGGGPGPRIARHGVRPLHRPGEALDAHVATRYANDSSASSLRSPSYPPRSRTPPWRMLAMAPRPATTAIGVRASSPTFGCRPSRPKRSNAAIATASSRRPGQTRRRTRSRWLGARLRSAPRRGGGPFRPLASPSSPPRSSGSPPSAPLTPPPWWTWTLSGAPVRCRRTGTGDPPTVMVRWGRRGRSSGVVPRGERPGSAEKGDGPRSTRAPNRGRGVGRSRAPQESGSSRRESRRRRSSRRSSGPRRGRDPRRLPGPAGDPRRGEWAAQTESGRRLGEPGFALTPDPAPARGRWSEGRLRRAIGDGSIGLRVGRQSWSNVARVRASTGAGSKAAGAGV